MLVPLNMFKPSSTFTDRSNALLLLWIYFCYLCFYFVFVMMSNFVITCWERGWPLGSFVFCVFICFSVSHMVYPIKCGTWLYRFLIFAFLFTFSQMSYYVRISRNLVFIAYAQMPLINGHSEILNIHQHPGQQKLRWVCTYAQTHLSLGCSHSHQNFLHWPNY